MLTVSQVIAADALAAQQGESAFLLMLTSGETVSVEVGSLRRGDDDGHQAGEDTGHGLTVLVDQPGGTALLGRVRRVDTPHRVLYSTSLDTSRALLDAGVGTTAGIVLTLRLEGSSETFHVQIQPEDYTRFESLAARVGDVTPPAHALPATAPRVGIQNNWQPAVPGQVVTADVYDLTTGAEAGSPGGPNAEATYMAVSATEAVVVPPDVAPWLHAFASAQRAIAAQPRF